ncbi:class I SAM-dependent methyltransferase [Stutzerimonas urumqiensis]|uniref:class I SAM-dependent methyltransferase n=1 Tax=Stutzerimonas urumqiensis TaxID=638269 RepID=UPI003DA43FBA
MSASVCSNDILSSSAYRMAIARALHGILEEPVAFEDRFALDLLEPETRMALLHNPFPFNDPKARSMRAGVVGRTLMAESAMLHALRSNRVRQVVLLGAGLDTFSLRYSHAMPDAQFYEVDRAGMLAFKAEKAARTAEPVAANVHCVDFDFESALLLPALTSQGFDVTQAATFSWLGVTPYLDEETVWQSLEDIASLPEGTSVTFDYRVYAELLDPIEQMISRFTAKLFADMGEPWISAFEPSALLARLHCMGFRELDHLGYADLNERYFPRRKDGFQIAGGGFNYVTATK